MIPLMLVLIAAGLFGLPLFIVLLGITYTAFSQGGGYVDVIPLEMYHILTDKHCGNSALYHCRVPAGGRERR